MTDTPTHCGLVAVAGRPNVGKSTLVNALVGEKVSIVTRKPQTTRHRIVGVYTSGVMQIGFVDTPGMHTGQAHALNRVLNHTASSSLSGVDAVLFVVEAGRWTDADEKALLRIAGTGLPIGLVINKIDQCKNRDELLPYVARCGEHHDFAFIVPLSARRRDNLTPLIDELRVYLPAGPFLFPEDEYTDRSLRFMVAETVREKLMMELNQELPYSIAVETESFQQQEEQLAIHALIWVARDSHKAIVIGRGGSRLKRVGRKARLELVERLGIRVDLRLWVKVREDWINDESAVHNLGH